MKLSELDPAIGRLMICQADLKAAKEQNVKMHEALILSLSHIRIWSTVKNKNPELEQLISEILKQIKK